MSFPRYPKYKDSGVEWISEIPVHWKSIKGHSILREKYETNKGMVSNNLLSLSFGRIVRRDVNTNDGLLPESFETYQVVDPGEIVFRPTDLQNDWNSLRSAIVTERGIITSAYIAVKPRDGSCWFLNYLFRAYDLAKVFYSMGGGLRQAFKFKDIGNLPLIFPPPSEQHAIASFLDRETAKIDALIAEQQRLIELLQEKRQAVISHAVTKGLNPDAPMKDSGIEWLGEVPAHWEVGALKHFVLPIAGAIKTGPFGSHLKSTEMESGEIKVYNQRNVIDNDFSIGENYVAQSKYAELSAFETMPGDILVTTRGTIGRAAILPVNAEKGILHPCLLRVQVDESKLLRGFLIVLINGSGLLKEQFSYLSNATTIEVIYSSTMASVVVPIPPVDEQKEIMDFLGEAVSRIQQLGSEAERVIALLQERRSALISAAVTGQIDVRGLAPKEAA
jgi:type I restriction enzyme S subunit